jgi:endonuclease YncB( thermonuclease family)
VAALLFLAPTWTAAAPTCEAAPGGRALTVRHVHDGDTLILEDGRRLRLTGVDTPEVARDGKPAEPLADQARQHLRQMLGREPRLRLLADRESADRYGRHLAHAYLPDGGSVQRELLAAGLAVLHLVPPNTLNAACYAAAEAGARQARRGLWALPQYQPVAAEQLPADSEGYRLVRGRVAHVGESRDAIWLNLEGGIALRLDRDSVPAFGVQAWNAWRGRQVEARGKLRRHDDGWRMTILHPHALQRLDG